MYLLCSRFAPLLTTLFTNSLVNYFCRCFREHCRRRSYDVIRNLGIGYLDVHDEAHNGDGSIFIQVEMVGNYSRLPYQGIYPAIVVILVASQRSYIDSAANITAGISNTACEASFIIAPIPNVRGWSTPPPDSSMRSNAQNHSVDLGSYEIQDVQATSVQTTVDLHRTSVDTEEGFAKKKFATTLR